MQGFQKLKMFFAGVLLAASSFSFSTTSSAQIVDYYWSGIYAGVYVGWGWYGPWVAVGVPYPVPIGYSYLPYYQYLPRYASYAAISYSPSADTYGVAWGEAYLNQAINDANDYCGKSDCRALVWVQGGCAAVSSAPKGAFSGWAYNTSETAAEAYAKNACRRASKDTATCTNRAWVCSY